MNTLLEIKNLSAGYEDKVALEGVNLTIKTNDFLGIIGPNGGGKTTLIKCILNLHSIWKGEIKWHLKKSQIGYLPQFSPFDKAFPISVKEVVLSGLMGKKKCIGKFSLTDKEKAVALMRQAGVFELKDKTFGNLSGGQMQRTLLCRAMINDPLLLILDEPATFVDSQFESELFVLLSELNKKTAILMVSHDVGMISSHVKTIACVNKKLYYHDSNRISAEQLAHYDCPIQLITHGEVPHSVLSIHK